MTNISNKFFVIVAVTFLFFPFYSFAADSSIGIKISPVIIDEGANPGEVMQKLIKVTNEANTARILYPYIRDFRPNGENGEAKLLPPGEGDESSLAYWVKMSSDGIFFEPHEEKEIPFVIEIPQSAGPGGYYGAIVFGSQPPKLNLEGGERGAAIAIAQQAGALILLQVKGEAFEDAEVREFTTDKDFYNTPFEINFLVRVENKGNVHIKPNGTIEIRNMLGREVNVLRMNDKLSNVLPKSIRKFQGIWKGDFGFGRYKASLIMAYGTPITDGGNGVQTLYQEKYFWIIPWKIIIPLVIGIIGALALFYLFLRFYKTRAIKKAMSEIGLNNVTIVKKKTINIPSPAIPLGLIISIIVVITLIITSVVYFLFFA